MSLEQHYSSILTQLGEDVNREGLLDTPKRAAKAMKYLCRGYQQSLEEVVNGALFSSDNSEMVLVKDIELYSLCEHHLLPFIGRAHIAYIPKNGRIIGLSKFARIVDCFARRPQVQERLTGQIADFLFEQLEPLGVAVFIQAEHLCMTMRGARAAGAMTQTSALRGCMRSDAKTRAEVMALLGGK